MDAQQQLMTDRLVALTIEELELRGPMTVDVLSQFVADKFKVRYGWAVELFVVKGWHENVVKESEGRILGADSPFDDFVRLSERPDEEQRLPSPTNFIQAYYVLLEKYKASRSGEISGIPESIVDDLYGRHS